VLVFLLMVALGEFVAFALVAKTITYLFWLPWLSTDKSWHFLVASAKKFGRMTRVARTAGFPAHPLRRGRPDVLRRVPIPGRA
jgi:hypothetical protein